MSQTVAKRGSLNKPTARSVSHLLNRPEDLADTPRREINGLHRPARTMITSPINVRQHQSSCSPPRIHAYGRSEAVEVNR
jgi:hypothetical protein